MNDTDAGQWPRGDGEMAGRIRAFDGSGSPLGGIETWTDRCHSVVDMVLASGFPAVVLVGPELIQIYNDGYCAIMGDKHPAGLGQPTRDCWPEVWHINAPIYRRVAGGETVTFQDALYPIRRDGALEDAWFTLSYSPLRERDGTVADILVTVVETSERVRSRNALQDSEARFRAFVNASSDVVYRMSPDWTEMRQLDGRGFLADTTEASETWLDRYIRSDDQPMVRAAIAHAVRTKTPFELEHRVIRADGSPGWTFSRAVPILDADGGIAEWLGAASDVTERKLARQAERASEALRRIALAGGGMGTWRWDLGSKLVWGDARFLALWGFPPSDEAHPLALFTERMSPEGAAAMEVVVAKAIEAGEEFDGSLEIVAGPTAGHWIRWRGRADDDAPSVLYGVTFDITEQRSSERTLAASEERFRTFAENSADVLWIVDAKTGQLDYLSPAFEAMWGESRERIMGDIGRFVELVHPDDRDRVAAAMPRLLAGESTQVEYRIVRPADGAVRWLQDTGFPIRDMEGRVVRGGGIVQDVTERREKEEALQTSEAGLQVMVAELHHRTRNLIGVVGMIMRQVLASSPTLADFRTRFTERLEALSRVQSLLSRPGDERITIGDIVRVELDALGADLSSDRVRIEGETVVLRKSTVQTLALAIHELATNARKYGALHADAGVLAVCWQEYRTEAGGRRLRFVWTETGIDPVVEETEGPMHRGGYGRKLIEEALPYTLKAKTTYTLGSERLDCTIDMPLDG